MVPVSIDGTRHVMRKGELTTRPGHATLVVVHEPIDTPGMAAADARSLAERLRAIVAAGCPGRLHPRRGLSPNRVRLRPVPEAVDLEACGQELRDCSQRSKAEALKDRNLRTSRVRRASTGGT